MDGIAMQICAICGDCRSARDLWFLIAENRWEDKLKILQWNDRLARQPGVMHACGAAHVQELVVHWMTTGSLDYPFARSLSANKTQRKWNRTWRVENGVDTDGVRQIGEIAVDRESMRRVLTESPQSLKAILDALISVLHRESMPPEAEIESENEVGLALSRET